MEENLRFPFKPSLFLKKICVVFLKKICVGFFKKICVCFFLKKYQKMREGS